MNNHRIKTLSRLALTGVLLLLGPAARAEGPYSQLTYNIAIPGGDTRNFIDSTSFIGVGFEFRQFATEQVTIGGSFAWQVFDSEESGTISIRDDEFTGDVTGTQFRYINALPLLLTSHYHFGSEKNLYAGIGAGAYRIEQRLELGTNAANANIWQFGIAPEIGFRAAINDRLGGAINVRWNRTFASGRGLSGESESHSWLSVNIGFTINYFSY